MSKIISYCCYCKEPIYEDAKFTIVNGEYYHYDPTDPYESCYFPGDSEEDLVDDEGYPI